LSDSCCCCEDVHGVRPAEVSPVIGFANLPKPEDEDAECEPEISAFYHHGSSNSNNGHSSGESRRPAAVNMTNSPYYACTNSHFNPSSNHRHLSPFGRLNSYYPLSQQQSSLSHTGYSPYASDSSAPPAESPLSSSSANESVLDAEPPRAGDGWRNLAGSLLGGGGGPDPNERRTMFGVVSSETA
jgi:hypothetical protein